MALSLYLLLSQASTYILLVAARLRERLLLNKASPPTPLQEEGTIQRVVDEVSRVTGISEEEIYSTKQQAAVTHARKITFYVIREVTGMSYVAIGKEFKKDHSTIMYNVNSIEKIKKLIK